MNESRCMGRDPNTINLWQIKQTMTIKGQGEKGDRSVSFNSRVTVVLIPERREIKEAQCDLWWTRSDFSSFQQAAHNEIRLYSLYENVNCKEAKNLLYQPNQTAEAENSIEDDYVEIEEEQLDMNSRDSELEEQEANTSLASPSKLMRHVDSVSLLAAYEENPVDTPLLRKAKSSLPNFAHIERTPSVSYEDPDFYVSLCVPSVEFDSLSTKESLCGGTATQSSSKVSHRIDQSSGFAVVCGIFSFTLPILGFYLMHYSS